MFDDLKKYLAITENRKVHGWKKTVLLYDYLFDAKEELENGLKEAEFSYDKELLVKELKNIRHNSSDIILAFIEDAGVIINNVMENTFIAAPTGSDTLEKMMNPLKKINYGFDMQNKADEPLLRITVFGNASGYFGGDMYTTLIKANPREFTCINSYDEGHPKVEELRIKVPLDSVKIFCEMYEKIGVGMRNILMERIKYIEWLLHQAKLEKAGLTPDTGEMYCFMAKCEFLKIASMLGDNDMDSQTFWKRNKALKYIKNRTGVCTDAVINEVKDVLIQQSKNAMA